MKERKGTFIQRKNRTEELSKSKPKSQTKVKKRDGSVFEEGFTDKTINDFITPEGFIDMPKDNSDSRWDNGGWYKNVEMIHYCEYGAFGEGDYMEFQNLYSPNNPFKEIDEIIDNS